MDIEEITKTIKMVILPIGACEQHGPHLPFGVDAFDCYEKDEGFSQNWNASYPSISI